MRIAIAGGSGTVGAMLAEKATNTGHEVVILARVNGIDLLADSDLNLDGVDCVIDVTGTQTLSAAKSQRFFTTITGKLLAAEKSAAVAHHLALSIIGAAKAPFGFYAGKAAQEQLVQASSTPWTILRSTQFYEFAQRTAIAAGPWLFHPKMRSQPVAAASVAERLLELAEAGPRCDFTEIAGPAQMNMSEVLRAQGHVRVVEFNLPGRFGRTIRDGSILPDRISQPALEIRGPSLQEWVAERSAR